ncbi:energy-coupling factor transport system ATP-binding protein [Hydrogenispora ethanolica]|uniref:Energy-coupling factor transport system ATP-binding protein n=1 Tax=Hydrogenispora ethanolica TaxID=1082276 RepID=A0A4R1R8X5_HYDET|nr:ATP-binding cassette domain-containing protein [Hydrogenispora ethanolica]TCL62019.1 energy-coupling factor transport system ATP-binding protein [Hydrogenispora ethanolica]
MDPVIAVQNLSFTYPNAAKPALSGVTFQVAAGEFVGITGPAGAGKSTLTLCLNGIIPHFQEGAFAGKVLIQGRDSFAVSCAELARSIGSVFQDPEAQIVAPSVEEEIAFGLENLAVDPPEIDRRIDEALELIGIAGLRHRSTTELSGGQKQRVAIAAAVALQPQILILDEPTSELDPLGTMEVFEVLKVLNQRLKMTIVVVEQKINTLMEYIGRLIILKAGTLVADQPPRAIISRPELLLNVGLKPPPVSELAFGLQEAGFYAEELPLTVDEAYWGLLKCFSKHGGQR